MQMSLKKTKSKFIYSIYQNQNRIYCSLEFQSKIYSRCIYSHDIDKKYIYKLYVHLYITDKEDYKLCHGNHSSEEVSLFNSA